MKKLLIVTCTKAQTDKEFEQRPIFQSLKKQYESNSDIEFFIFKDNKKGLPICYNEIIQAPENKDKMVLFVHDDVVLEDLFLYEKLMSSPYTITGLAGTKTFDKNKDKLAWNLASERNHFIGEVAHSSNSSVWTTVFGQTKSRALILDGLFLACKVSELVEKNLLFDTDFEFHFYDVAFCLSANEKQITCGVLPIRVIHFGLGDSLLTSQWENANLLFKQKYCL
jgi:hypothetical protein